MFHMLDRTEVVHDDSIEELYSEGNVLSTY